MVISHLHMGIFYQIINWVIFTTDLKGYCYY